MRLTELSTNIEELGAALRSGLQTLDFNGRRKIIELLIDRVILSHEDIEIRYAIPLTGVNPTGKKETLRLPYRAHARVAQSVPSLGQGLREPHALCGGLRSPRFDSPDVTQTV